MKQREKIVPAAMGVVLEVGIGSGLNFSFYDPQHVHHLVGRDPSEEIWKERTYDLNSLLFDFQFPQASVEDIPVGNHCFDTVMVTYTLCSIKEPECAFYELHRVMKSTGRPVFCEHGKASDKQIEEWQRRLNPICKRIGGGCNLHRDLAGIINSNGFHIDPMASIHVPGWRPTSFNPPCATAGASYGGTRSRSASGAYAKASATACGLCLPSAAKGLPTALRVAAFSLRSQGYFGEEGSAKQGERMWFNLPVPKGWPCHRRQVPRGLTRKNGYRIYPGVHHLFIYWGIAKIR